MSDPFPSYPNRPYDYVVIDGMAVHKRWFNPDGTRKAGAELEREKLKIELELIAERLLASPPP